MWQKQNVINIFNVYTEQSLVPGYKSVRVEEIVILEISRYFGQFQISVKCIFPLVLIPSLVWNKVSKILDY